MSANQYRHWPKHEMPSSRNANYDRNDRNDHYTKPMYSRDEELERKPRYLNERQRYRISESLGSQSLTQSQSVHASQYMMHSQQRNTQYHPHFSHTNTSAVMHGSDHLQHNIYQQDSWSFNSARDGSGQHRQFDYRRGNFSNLDEKQTDNR